MKRWGSLHRKQFNQDIEWLLGTLDQSKLRIYPRYLDRFFHDEGDSGRDDRAVVMASFPPARTNKYQYLLYKQALHHGYHILPILDHQDVDCIPWPGDMILHIHWTAGILREAEDEDQARSAGDDFIDYLTQLKVERGVKLVWTAHNLLPHGARYPDIERSIRQRMIDLVDAIHLLTDNSLTVLSDAFSLDADKTFVTPHPSYVSSYANFSSKADARIELNIDQGAKVLLLFGAISEYKGVGFLIEHFDELCANSQLPLHLVLAGAPSDEEVASRVEAFALGRSNVTTDLRKIPDDQLHFFFNAADAVVTPYVEGLNSGVQLLGLTFNKPVLAPGDTNMAELASPLFHTFSSQNFASFAQCVERAISHDPGEDELRKNAEFIEGLDPTALSDEFFEKLNKILFP